jgi:hypothetical protein
MNMLELDSKPAWSPYRLIMTLNIEHGERYLLSLNPLIFRGSVIQSDNLLILEVST